MAGPTHEGGAGTAADDRIRRRAQIPTLSQPARNAAAVAIILHRQVSAPGEGTMVMAEIPKHPTKLASEQTKAVMNIVRMARRLTLRSSGPAPLA